MSADNHDAPRADTKSVVLATDFITTDLIATDLIKRSPTRDFITLDLVSGGGRGRGGGCGLCVDSSDRERERVTHTLLAEACIRIDELVDSMSECDMFLAFARFDRRSALHGFAAALA